MEPSNWAPEHSDALRDFLTKGMSFSEAARAINAKFGTCYTRNAAIGRGKRMGLGTLPRIESPSIVPPLPNRPRPVRRFLTPLDFIRPPASVLKRAEPVPLRCVAVKPRLVSLLELGPDQCRYPYGGDSDGEVMTFCGHPKRAGSSYCAPHARLAGRREARSERPTGPFVLRLVTTA